MAKVAVIAMVVDTKVVTLYHPDGSKTEIPQGDPQTKRIVDAVLPVVSQQKVAMVDLTQQTDVYSDFQEVAAGLVQLFRVAKRLVKPMLEQLEAAANLEGSEEPTEAPVVTSGSFGVIPTSETAKASETAPKAAQPDISSAVSEIMANAVSASSPEFHAPTTEEQTIVAKVGDKIIPGVEALKGQFEYSAANKDSKGVQNLLSRMAAVADKRMHSVQDLLRFLEQGDLPIADDGSIIAYKALTRKGDHYVDCHTKKVAQRVGSFVYVDEALVDKNRRNECSNGLHIARRGYLGSFGGDVIVMCKIAPEDVITVPHNDPNKVRVCGYHILAELSDEARNKLKSNRPATDIPEVKKLLSDVIAGKHIGITEKVHIGGSLGSNINVTQMNGAKNTKETKTAVAAAPASKPKVHTALDDPTLAKKKEAASRVDPKLIATGSRAEKARALVDVLNDSSDVAHRKVAAEQLIAFKKQAKVGWDKLGISASMVEDIEAAAAAEVKPEAPKVEAVSPPKTRQQLAREYYSKSDWAGLYDFKRKAKVSWAQLGFTESEIEKINKNNPGA